MKFVLTIQPEIDNDHPTPTPGELVRYAIAAIEHEGLLWDIFDDDGNLLANGVSVNDHVYEGD